MLVFQLFLRRIQCCLGMPWTSGSFHKTSYRPHRRRSALLPRSPTTAILGGPITGHTTLATLPTFRTTKPIAPRENYSLHRCGLTTFDSDRDDARGKVLVELWTSVRLGGVCGCNRPSLGCLLPFSDSACAGSSKNPRLASSTAQCSDQLSVVLAGRSNLLAETPPLLLNAVCHQPW